MNLRVAKRDSMRFTLVDDVRWHPQCVLHSHTYIQHTLHTPHIPIFLSDVCSLHSVQVFTYLLLLHAPHATVNENNYIAEKKYLYEE